MGNEKRKWNKKVCLSIFHHNIIILLRLLYLMGASETQDPRKNTMNFGLLSDLIKRGEECIEAIDDDESVIFALGEVSILSDSCSSF